MTKNEIQLLFEYAAWADSRLTDFMGNTNTQPLYQQMQHKMNHSSYHRGQFVAMLKRFGAAVVSTDLISYIRQKEIHG
jgi:uncharacterized damage-inducible protein DinB